MIGLVVSQPAAQLLVGIALIFQGRGQHNQHSVDELIAPATLEPGAVELARRHQDAVGPGADQRVGVLEGNHAKISRIGCP
jgi:hypothetical protein